MARPRLSDHERRSELFIIRLTPTERLALIAEAERLSISPTELARQRMIRGRVVVQAHRQLDPRQVFELGKIGVNLNQIARALNSRQNINPDAITSAIDELKKLIASLMLDGGPALIPAKPVADQNASADPVRPGGRPGPSTPARTPP